MYKIIKFRLFQEIKHIKPLFNTLNAYGLFFTIIGHWIEQKYVVDRDFFAGNRLDDLLGDHTPHNRAHRNDFSKDDVKDLVCQATLRPVHLIQGEHIFFDGLQRLDILGPVWNRRISPVLVPEFDEGYKRIDKN